MNNEIMTIEKNEVLETAKKYLTSLGCNIQPKHQEQFLEICRSFKLNPFTREIYAIPYGNNFNVIVGYEVYIKRAEQSGQLAGWKAWSEGEGAELKGVVEIYRKDWREPFRHEVYFSEYNQNNSMWKSKPRTMIKKVAIAQGFRMCFSCELGGMPYTADEIPLEEKAETYTAPQAPQIETPKRNLALEFSEKLKSKGLSKEEIRNFCLTNQIKSSDEAKLQTLLDDEGGLDLLIQSFLKEESETQEVEAEEIF
ncbi:phage recombination protein Bet [Helicobacter pullorum]|uniref:phage recombination protein Bet n=1 Tax=Helicobacter pullorum TaxID=35818 RepID=UPI0006BACB1E|nr:phage recombination protein Bet [Helicobacter pullorum]